MLLAIDCAGAGCAVALADKAGAILAQQNLPMQRGQDAALLPLVQTLLAAASVPFTALARIAVVTGPGSFTGLRVGLAAAQGLAVALRLPLWGVTSFQARLWQYAHLPADLPRLVVVDSRRDELFYQLFDAHNQPQSQPAFATAPELAQLFSQKLYLLADVPLTLPQSQLAAPHWPDLATSMAVNIAVMPDAQHADFAAVPFYLRAPDVTLPTTARSH